MIFGYSGLDLWCVPSVPITFCTSLCSIHCPRAISPAVGPYQCLISFRLNLLLSPHPLNRFVRFWAHSDCLVEYSRPSEFQPDPSRFRQAAAHSVFNTVCWLYCKSPVAHCVPSTWPFRTILVSPDSSRPSDSNASSTVLIRCVLRPLQDTPDLKILPLDYH